MRAHRIFCCVVAMLLLLAANAPAQVQAVSAEQNVYVPLDSWVYPALEHLIARGLVDESWSSLRPWRRIDCLHMAEAAEEAVASHPEEVEGLALIRQLEAELRAGRRFSLDAVSQRLTAVGGTPLNDGFHFAQTMVNDDGRSFGEGANLFTGVTAHGGAGPFSGFVQAELQRVAAAGLPLSAAANAAIAGVDFTPQAQAGPGTGFARARLMQAYGAFTFGGNQIIAGRQTLWWGPARSGATLFSSNAEPVNMVRYDRTAPVHLTGPLRWLGGVRAQVLVGRLAGAQFVHADHTTFGVPGVALGNQPWIHAEKFAFQPARWFEFSVSRSVLFAGQGAPFTTRSFVNSLFSPGTGDETKDPGDRRSAFDALVRVPHTRHCLSAYVDTFTDDEPFPLAYVKESAWITGFSLTCAPRTKSLALRAEGLVTPHRDILPGFYYFNVHYLSGYTQQRQLIGSWIGREGKGSQVWATWHVSRVTTLEASVRAVAVDHEFLQGGNLQDVALHADHTSAGALEWRGGVQWERWRFPLVQSSSRQNVSVTLELIYRPKKSAE